MANKFFKTPSGNFIKISSGSFLYSNLEKISVISGGTATGVTLSNYSAAQQNVYKQELINSGIFFSQEELLNAVVLNISGTSTGTVIIDVSDLGNVGDIIKLLHKKTSTGAWETLYNGAIPSNERVTVTLTEFSPIVGKKFDINTHYLCFEAQEATDIAFTVTGTLHYGQQLKYKLNNSTWTDYTFGNNVSLAQGDKCYWKGSTSYNHFSESTSNRVRFSSTGLIKASGNIMSLVDSNLTLNDLAEYAFYTLFSGCTTLTSAKIIMPATNLSNYAYRGKSFPSAGVTVSGGTDQTYLYLIIPSDKSVNKVTADGLGGCGSFTPTASTWYTKKVTFNTIQRCGGYPKLK